LSLQKSGRGAKQPKAAKPAKAPKKAAATGRGAARTAPGGRQIYVQAARSDVYVTLLGVSLGAILIGIIFLAVLLNRYEFKTKVSSVSSTAIAQVV
jgi:hypothetical protein